MLSAFNMNWLIMPIKGAAERLELGQCWMAGGQERRQPIVQLHVRAQQVVTVDQDKQPHPCQRAGCYEAVIAQESAICGTKRSCLITIWFLVLAKITRPHACLSRHLQLACKIVNTDVKPYQSSLAQRQSQQSADGLVYQALARPMTTL